MRTILRRFAPAALLALLASPVQAAATITIVNMDGALEGFNDPTPVSPVGGNPGTTLGQQRLNAFQRAADIWATYIDSPVPILIQAAFNPLTCTATSATLGSAGPRFAEINHPNAEFANYWYHEALANKQAGVDLTLPGEASPTDNGSDINAQFNSNIGTTGCLEGRGWYYGYDGNEGTNIDLVAVLLHEFAHGLGFSNLTSGSTGNFFNGSPAVFDKFLYDETTGLHWDQMTLATQRQASAINTNNLVWDGIHTTVAGNQTLAASPEMVAPYGNVLGNAAAFGPAFTSTGVTGQAVLAVDAVAPTGDACSLPASLTGRIAVIDRGTCSFNIKVKFAQDAGAIAVILVNNTTGTFSPGGTDPTITIPTIAITQADGNTLKSAIAAGTVNVTLRISPTARAGVHPSGRVRMYSPNPFQSGSSVSHFDVSLTPNALMEPSINADLGSGIDLTQALFRDIGWIPSLLDAPGRTPSSRIALASRPNPARGGTSVRFELPSEESLTLVLHDVAGREVRTLANGRFEAGAHDVRWDGLDAAGRPAAPGVYMARLKGSRTQVTRAIVLVQ